MSAGINAYRIENKSGASTSIFTAPFVVGNSPAGIVVHPSNHFAYVANQLDNSISLLKIDTTSGALTEVLPRTSVGAGTQPAILTMDSGGKYLFVGDVGSNDVTTFSIASSGALSPIGAPMPVGSSPSALVLPSADNFLYVSVPNFSAVYAFAVSAGQLTPVVGSPFLVANGLSSVTVAPSGNFLYVPNPTANTISGFSIQSSGALTAIQTSPFVVTCGSTTNCAPFGAAVDPSNKYLYLANYAQTTLSQFTIDSSTGALTAISTTHAAPTAGTNPAFIVFDPNGTRVYVANVGSKTITELTMNSDGSLTTAGNTIQVGSVPLGIAFTR